MDQPVHPDKLIDLVRQYDKGVVTRTELCMEAFAHFTAENIGPFLADCPREVLGFLIEEEPNWPIDEDDQQWERLMVFGMGSWVNATRESVEQYFMARQQRIRPGVRLFRAWQQHGGRLRS